MRARARLNSRSCKEDHLAATHTVREVLGEAGDERHSESELAHDSSAACDDDHRAVSPTAIAMATMLPRIDVTYPPI